MRFLKKVLILCFTALFLYTAVSIIYQCRTGTELAPVLTERFFPFSASNSEQWQQ